MSDCDDALHELYEFLDGELTGDRRAHIEAHLNNCSPCLEAFDFQAEVRLVIAHKCRDEAPADLMARIATALGLPAQAVPPSAAGIELRASRLARP